MPQTPADSDTPVTGRAPDEQIADPPGNDSGKWAPGPHPQRRHYGSFADFSDPDGNTWVLQEARRGEPGA